MSDFRFQPKRDIISGVGLSDPTDDSVQFQHDVQVINDRNNFSSISLSPDLLFEWLTGTFGILSGFLLYLILHFVWHFRIIVFAYLADWLEAKFLNRNRLATFKLTYEYINGRSGRSVVRVAGGDENRFEIEPLDFVVVEPSLQLSQDDDSLRSFYSC